MSSTDPFGDSAILFLGDSANSQNSSSNAASADGHQILDQVQKELQFLPSQNDDLFVTGSITTPNQLSTTTTVEIVPSNSSNRPDTFGQPPADGGDDPGQQSSKKYTIWQFEYYAQYFNLTTDMFWQRVIWSCFPLSSGNRGTYNERFIQGNPDLYGPFWIAMTLAVTISIGDNLIKFFNWKAPIECDQLLKNVTTTAFPQCNHPHLKFTFEHLYSISSITFMYLFMAPLIFWAFCRWRGCSRTIPFLECLCSYGYSLSIFIPITVLSMINIREVQFILFFSGAFLSGANLLVSFSQVVSSDPGGSLKLSYIVLIFTGFAHLFLALFYLYIFL